MIICNKLNVLDGEQTLSDEKSNLWRFSIFVALSVIFSTGLVGYARAQSIPDGTFGSERTRLRSENLIDYVAGGALRGDSLFHSFERLRVGRQRSLIFESDGVERIFTRVTGDDTSRINGLLGTTGQSDLYLINPNGIAFGPNARLNIGGSFVASTADSFTFPDFEFGVEQPEAVPPALTIRDWGLQVGSDSGSIRAVGNGHSLTTTYDEAIGPLDITPYLGLGSEDSLSVSSSESLVLIGSGISADGGVLSAPSGHIYLSSVRDAEFSFNSSNNRLNVNRINGIPEPIDLYNYSLLDVSGEGGGYINVFADDLFLAGGSLIIDQNQGLLPGGGLFIEANTLNIEGFDIFGLENGNGIPLERTSGIASHTFLGEGSNIQINSNNLTLKDGGFVAARTYGLGAGGSILIDSNNIEIFGFERISGSPSIVEAATYSSGKGGSIQVNATDLNVYDNGIILTSTFPWIDPSQNNFAGDLRLNIDRISLRGGIRNGASNLNHTFVSSISLGEGGTGQLTISADEVDLFEGAVISNVTFGSGYLGGIEISSNRLTIQGTAIGINAQIPNQIEFADFPGVGDFSVTPRSSVVSSRILNTPPPGIIVSNQDTPFPLLNCTINT